MSKIKSVTMYTTGVCAYCHAEKEFLKQHDIKFDEVRVDTDAQAAEEFINLSGQMGVPFTVVKKADDTEEHILGFDQPRLAHALGI
ncbi:MAG TPA: glutaredoxin domain-containing protein [Candidatus Saccharimonadales bacterium]|nr:glutaredoxin domain-containing protein [Candidatus Saccharimonadales bacterium]